MTRLLPFALALLSCGPSPEFEPSCVSACGQRLYGADGCASFQAHEDRVLAFVPCRRLRGVVVSVVPADADGVYADWWGRRVWGEVRCDRNAIQIGGWAVYPHEVMHLSQCPLEDHSHETWTGEMWRAVAEASE